MRKDPSERWRSERQLLWEVTVEMVQQSMVAGSSGNVSMRLAGDENAGSNILITPAGRPYRQLGPDDLVVIDLDGEPVEGDLMPSSEAATHLRLYRERREVESVVHTHSPYASAAAVAGLEIPPVVDEMVIEVGGSVEVAEYAFPSTAELAEHVYRALGDRNAVLLRNHGLIGVGPGVWEALGVCQLVERAAQIFLYASLLDRVLPLPQQIVEMEQDLFRMRRETQLQSIAQAGPRGKEGW